MLYCATCDMPIPPGDAQHTDDGVWTHHHLGDDVVHTLEVRAVPE